MSDAMEVVYFLSKRFKEIPEQDNPVFNTTTYSGKERRITECILVCKVGDIKSSGVGDGFTVIYVPYEGEITSKGRFWNAENATLFAESLASYLNFKEGDV